MDAMARPQKASYSSVKDCEVAGEFIPVDMLPGASMKMLREDPTTAIFRVKAGTIEALHHHKCAYDLLMMKGKKMLWNLSSGKKYDLVAGDYLFTPAGDRHRALYLEDTEIFIKWDGHWDFILDEDDEKKN